MVNRTISSAVTMGTQPRKLYGRVAGPRVLLASPPKTGTNLLIRVLSDFPQLRSSGTAVGTPAETTKLLKQISQIQRGEVLTTHIWWSTDLQQIMRSQRILGVFLLRDPRATCVSHYHYIMREAGHWCHRYFHERLHNESERIMAVITGINETLPNGESLILPSIDKHFRRRLGYLSDPAFCTVRFEELVGSRGGGDDQMQLETVNRMARHLGLALSNRDRSAIISRAFSSKSPTFRSGQIDSWREEMTPEHISRFKEIAGSLLIELGYEANTDW